MRKPPDVALRIFNLKHANRIELLFVHDFGPVILDGLSVLHSLPLAVLVLDPVELALSEDSAVLSGGQLLFPSGSRIDTSPAYTAGATAQYSFPLTSTGWTGQLEAVLRYTSEETTTAVSSGSG